MKPFFDARHNKKRLFGDVRFRRSASAKEENHQETPGHVESVMAAAVIRPSQLAALTRTRCSIFQTAYNPTSARTGAKYLRARLRGPSMVRYYPPEANIAKVIRQWPELEMRNYAEEERLQDVEDRKKRGKGAPKKAKEKGELKLYSALLRLTLVPGDSRRASRKR